MRLRSFRFHHGGSEVTEKRRERKRTSVSSVPLW
jgi:hypothetical protein